MLVWNFTFPPHRITDTLSLILSLIAFYYLQTHYQGQIFFVTLFSPLRITNMRQLTAKQKKLLDNWIESQKDNSDLADAPFTNNRYSLGVDDLPIDIYEKLENINDTEILYQEVDRYVYDQSNKILNRR